MLRRGLVLAHRWAGIALAIFLIPVSLTGSVLAWGPVIDSWINPTLHFVASRESLSEAELVARVRAAKPGIRVAGVDLPSAPGRSARVVVGGWIDPADAEHRINEAFVDPATGLLLGARSTTTPRFSRLELLAWLKRFHYTLMLKRTGMVLMGIVAIAWLLDAFVGALLTLPKTLARWRKWHIAWKVKGSRLSYDLHRAGGLWLWPVLVVMAASSVYLNLGHEVFVPGVEFIAARLLPESVRLGVTETILEWQQPLHTGQAFGLAGPFIVSLAGLSVAALAITGLRTAWRKLVPATASRPSSSSSDRAPSAVPARASAHRRSPRSA